MLSFLPFIGPILDGIVKPVIGYFTTKNNNATEILKTETDASARIIEAGKDDWGIRLARDFIIWPWAAWSGAIGWDYLIYRSHPTWIINPIAEVTPAIAYMPYAVIVFLL